MPKLSRPWFITAGVALVLIVVLAGVAIARVRASDGRLYLTPASSTVANGSTVTLSIKEDSGSTPVNAVQANLSYDPSKLQFENISSTGSAFGIQAQASGGSGGRVTIARATSGGAAPVTGSQLVATVTLRALAGSGSSTVSFAAGSALVRAHGNAGLPISFSTATVHFAAGPSQPTMSPALTPTPSPTPVAHQTPAPAPAAGSTDSATMYLSPASGSVGSGGNLTFDIHENSGAATVNAVEADYSYPTSQYDFVSISGDTSAFGLQIQSSGDNGHLVIIRGTTPGSNPLSGDHIVATVTLKATGSGTAAVTPAGGSAVLRSTNNTNILKNITGGSYQLGG